MALPHSIDDEAIATDAVDMGTLLTDNKTLQAENKTLHERLLRALAEAENVRHQAERTISEARQYGISDFAREMLTIADNLQRTVDAAQTEALTSVENPALLEGVQATLRGLLQALERFGVRPIDAQGKPFDPNFHEAAMEVDDPSLPSGTVKQVLQPGYTINNRLLRPARVVVSKRLKKKSATTSEEPEDNNLGSFSKSPRIDP